MSVKLLTEQHLEFLSLKGRCTGSSESFHVKMPHCWQSHVMAHFVFISDPSSQGVRTMYSFLLLAISIIIGCLVL